MIGNKIDRDGYRIVIRQRQGDPGTVYTERRMALTWPSSVNPGYAALYGLQETGGQRPVELLHERTETTPELLALRCIDACTKYDCRVIYGDMGDDYRMYLRVFNKSLQRRGTRDISLFDSNAFNDFEQAIPEINRLNDLGCLIIPKDSTIRKQLSGRTREDLQPNDRIKPEHRLFALNTLNQVVLGWKYYPFQKPKDQMGSTPTEGYE